MNNADNSSFESAVDLNSHNLITDIYQRIEQLSPPEKVALAQHLINTSELRVVISGSATVDNAIQLMDHTDLGNTLEAIARQVRQLDQ